jgi:hypothetical protein
MKKTLMLIAAVCGLYLTGCASANRSNTVRMVNVGPEAVRPLPLTADLNISEQKTRGEARKENAKMGDEKQLLSEAVARALGHYPPRAEAADVLVAMNIYKQNDGKNMTVVVTGYPAWYHNFRSVEEKAPGDSAWLILTNTGKKSGGWGGGGLSLGVSGQSGSGKSSQANARTQNAEEPDRAAFGVHAGSRMSFVTDMDAGFGWEAGLALRIPISEKTNLSVGADFYFGDIGTVPLLSLSVNEMGISIPVFAQIKVPVGIPVYTGAGMVLGVNFGTKMKYSSYEIDVGDDRGLVDVGVGAGIGALFTQNLDVGLRYIFNINETLPGASQSLLCIGATYLF